MKKIISFFIALSVILFTNNTFAQDAKAKAILDAASKKMSSMRSMKSNFLLIMKNAQGKSLSTQKGILMLSGKKYRIQFDGSLIMTDGSTMWTYTKSSNEVQITKFNANANQISPTKIFSGSYEKEYIYKYLGERAVSGRTCNIIELRPKGHNNFIKIILCVSKTTNEVVGGDLFEKGGNVASLTISGLSVNPSDVNASSFVFDPKNYPKVEVIDLR